MRHIQILMFILTCITGCNDLGNPVSPVSDGVVSGPFLFTLIVPSASIPVNDTLRAIVQAYNQAATPETLIVGPSLFSWSLKTQTGRTVMWGPPGVPLYVIQLVVESHQTEEIYSIHQAIADTSGAPVTPGTYVLEAEVTGVSSMSLMLTLK